MNTEWEILTDDGWSDFSGLKISETDSLIRLSTANGHLDCTPGHRVLTNTGWVCVEKLRPKYLVKTANGYTNVVSVTSIKKSTKVYDIIGVDKGSKYLTNGIISHNCDEFAHLHPNLAEEFVASVFPTLSSSENSKLILISTPKGLNHFYKIWAEAENNSKNGFVAIEGKWTEHPGRSQKWADEQLAELGETKYAQEVLCNFIGSSYTLVDGTKLASVPLLDPLFSKDGLKAYKKPEKDHSYIITVDTSRGQYLDYSAFIVYDVTKTPYEVVATFKDNKISTLAYPFQIFNTAKQYNNAYLLIEINDIGQEVANTIWYEYEYENLYFTQKEKLTEARGYPGIRTTSKVKSVGCSVLKEMVDHQHVILNSYDIVQELGIFVQKGRSYASDDPAINDDLTTCLWLFAWLTKQPFFADVSNVNIRQLLAKQREQYIMDTHTPFGYFDDGRTTEEEVVKRDGFLDYAERVNPENKWIFASLNDQDSLFDK